MVNLFPSPLPPPPPTLTPTPLWAPGKIPLSRKTETNSLLKHSHRQSSLKIFSLRVHPLDDEKSTTHLGIQTWQKHTGLSQEYSQGEIDCFSFCPFPLTPLPPLTLPLRYRLC